MDQLRFDGQVAAICSCDYTLCGSIATDLASRGAKIVVGGENREAVEELVEEIKDAGGEVFVCAENIGASIVLLALEKFGRIDICVSFMSHAGEDLNGETSEATFNKYFFKTLETYYGAMKSAWLTFVKNKYGRILFITDHLLFNCNLKESRNTVAKRALFDFNESLLKLTENGPIDYDIKCNILAPCFDVLKPATNATGNITRLAVCLIHRHLKESGEIFHASEKTFGKVSLFKSKDTWLQKPTAEDIAQRWADINDWSEAVEVVSSTVESIDSTPLSLHHDTNSPIAKRLRISSPSDGLLCSSSSEQKPRSRSSSSDQTSVQTGHSSVMTEYTRKLREIRKEHEANYMPPSPRPFYVPPVLIGYNIVKRGKKLITFIFDFERSPVKVYTEICPHAYDVYEITEADFLAEIKEKMNAKGITDDEMEFQCIMRMLTSRISYANDNSYDDIFKMKSKNGPH
ncbi:unnamed protein product [Caenorhabditis bovis]|uniref:Uncharacterized protein n=1 Tax=Caenorhabditis bovis TaxID=2654633 RepID=A0A8S1FC72_9PELO|nr:unnamed protein product [Caenorhabditis bovis]